VGDQSTHPPRFIYLLLAKRVVKTKYLLKVNKSTFSLNAIYRTPTLSHDSVFIYHYKICVVDSWTELLEFLLFSRSYLLKSAKLTH
jgi:hypothetical protein